MPRPVRPWFRFYTEAFHDRKILRLTPTQRWIWAAVMGAARESPVFAKLYIAEGVPMTFAELARFADVKEREMKPAIDAMAALGMVSVEDGCICVTNWGSRQYESDDVTSRTRAHRERSKERSNTVPGNTPETETETETEKTLVSRKRATQAPDIFPITDSMRSWAVDNGVTVDLDEETQNFLDKNRAKGSTYKDWLAAWRTWMRNSKKFAPAASARSGPGYRPRDAWMHQYAGDR